MSVQASAVMPSRPSGRGSTRRPASIGLALLLLVLLGPPVTAQAALPAGFAITAMPTGLAGGDLTGFAFDGTGGWFATGKGGRLTWTSPSIAPRQLGTLDVTTTQDAGLVGVAVAPDWLTSRTIYTTRATAGPDSQLRLSAHQVTVDADGSPVELGPERVIVELPNRTNVHAMTDVLAADDGSLWVTVGDNASYWAATDDRRLDALDPDKGYGKLLHLWPDGSGVATNPFYSASSPQSWRSRVYALGFRSPFRVSMDPITGAPIVADVGANEYEEVDLVQPGASYGWPCFEGESPFKLRPVTACANQPNTVPLLTYTHASGMGTSITGGFVYTGDRYPEAYRGAYFFGDYGSARIYTARHDATGTLVRGPESQGLMPDTKAYPVDFHPAPNGDVVWADIGTGQLHRLSWVDGNRAPTAVFSVTTNPQTRTATFDASGSSDPDGDAINYRWDFGDGTSATGPTASHTYGDGTTFTVTLTTTDAHDATGTATTVVTPANHTPTLTLTTPADGTVFAVGDPVRLSASATDTEDGELAVRWSTTMVHCSGGYCHDHPGASTTGPAYAEPFADHGDGTYLRITTTATDAAGATVSRQWEARPKLRTVTVASTVAAPIMINSVVAGAHQVTVGSQVEVVAPELAGDGLARFAGWRDGRTAATLGFTMPDEDLTVEAVYQSPLEARWASDAALRDLLGPAISGESGGPQFRVRIHQNGQLHWTPATGVHELHGAIVGTYRAEGGGLVLGPPSSDELTTPDGRGRYNTLLTPDGGGAIYWSPTTPASLVHGAIFQRWNQVGGVGSPLGYPTSSERSTPGNQARYNDFVGGGIYWTASGGAREVHGRIYLNWAAQRWEQGPLGLPTTDETVTPDRIGRFNHFAGGSIYWTPATDAHTVRGAIRGTWAALGWELSPLGYPLTDEVPTPDGRGRFNHFERGSIYWTPTTGAHEVRGAIRTTWASLGWERSWLGYPTSNEYSVPGGRRSDFTGGSLVYSYSTGRVTSIRR